MAKKCKIYIVSILAGVVAAMGVAFTVTNALSQECPPGMISYWTFDDGTAQDTVGTNDGIIYGAIVVDGKVGKALSFDGSNDYVDAGTSNIFNFNNGTGNFTIDAWIKPVAMPGFASGIVAKAAQSPYKGWSFYFYSNGRLGFSWQGIWEITSAIGTIITGEWAHVAVTKDGTSYKLYKNGIEVSSTIYGSYHISTTSLKIGRVYPDGGPEPPYSLNGTIDEVAIYNRALTAEEIQQHYENGLNGLGYCELPTLEATIDIDSNTLNLNSQGKWITCYIELPEGYDVAEVDVSIIMLNNQVNAETHPTEIGDYDNDGVVDIMVKFDRSDVQEILATGDEVEITVTGEVAGTPFEGIDTIKVIEQRKK